MDSDRGSTRTAVPEAYCRIESWCGIVLSTNRAKENYMGTFKKGLFFGGLLGAGLMWLNTTKRGKELRDNLLDYAAEVYEEVKTKITSSKQWEKLTKNEYVRTVEEVVNKYAVEHDLSDKVRDVVEKVVKAQWKKVKGA